MKLKTRYNPIKRGIYLLLLLALPLFSLGDINSSLFEKGNTAYAKAQYDQAIKSYLQIVNGGNQSAAVYYNLGNAYYKTGDVSSALLYFEKAHKLSPGDEDINANIRFVNSKTSDKVEPIPEFFVNQWWHSFILYYSVNTLAILSVLFLLAGFGIIILYLFARSIPIKKASFYIGIVVILAGITSIFVANRQVSYFDAHHQAIIFNSSVIVKGSPNDNAKPLFVVHEGTKVDVIEINDTWIEVQLPNGNSGWITADNVKDI